MSSMSGLPFGWGTEPGETPPFGSGSSPVPVSPPVVEADIVGKSLLTDGVGGDVYLNNPLFGNEIVQETIRVANKTLQGHNRFFVKQDDLGFRKHVFVSPANLQEVVTLFRDFADYYVGLPIKYTNHHGLVLTGFLSPDYRIVENAKVWCEDLNLYKNSYNIEFTVIECL